MEIYRSKIINRKIVLHWLKIELIDYYYDHHFGSSQLNVWAKYDFLQLYEWIFTSIDYY